jgi:hypothetical protein
MNPLIECGLYPVVQDIVLDFLCGETLTDPKMVQAWLEDIHRTRVLLIRKRDLRSHDVKKAERLKLVKTPTKKTSWETFQESIAWQSISHGLRPTREAISASHASIIAHLFSVKDDETPELKNRHTKHFLAALDPYLKRVWLQQLVLQCTFVSQFNVHLFLFRLWFEFLLDDDRGWMRKDVALSTSHFFVMFWMERGMQFLTYIFHLIQCGYYMEGHKKRFTVDTRIRLNEAFKSMIEGYEDGLQ